MAGPRLSHYGYQRQIVHLLRTNDRVPMMADLGTPALASANRIVTSVTMSNAALTIANASSADGLARNVTATITQVGGVNDTPGTLAVVGTDLDGAALSETITLVANTIATGAKAFATVTSATIAGWVAGGTADTITVGTGNLIGLPKAITAAKDVITTTLAAAAVTVVATGDGTLAGSTVNLSSGTYDGSKQALALFVPAEHTVLTAAGAQALVTTSALGFSGEIEEFGCRVIDALQGSAGAQDFTLTDAGSNVIATLSTATASGARGATIKTTTIVSAYQKFIDTTTLTVNRKTGGTAFKGGAVEFYVRVRSRQQTAA